MSVTINVVVIIRVTRSLNEKESFGCVLLIFLTLRCPFQLLNRSVVIISRVFFYGDAELPSADWINYIKLFQIAQIGFTLTFLSFERICAVVDPKHEQRSQTTRIKILFPIAVIAPGIISVFVHALRKSPLGSGAETIFAVVAYIVSGITAQVVISTSQAKLRNRHVLRLRLAEKFASVENVRAMTLFLPCIRNELVCFGGISLLALYSMIYTDYPMGQDPTPLSHTYDLLGAYECLFVSVFLHYKCFRLRYHPIPPIELRFSRDEESDHYFNELRTSWA
ncbi:hypothetical protein PRIPAC_88287 [Pristionchus pacificus]|uniref:Uncharacterized protein n=1 Tax=Pristionchus pacificus TaxID=54126 RepID=A0A2A6CZ39_PRIPA|nr:hypothetical protein PRIPAC_88287 [Pristionchus pacificus]|eukprot:PDM83482.1 hypothetical protein PRIPAC_35114 [Pristionchus pacificus]